MADGVAGGRKAMRIRFLIPHRNSRIIKTGPARVKEIRSEFTVL